MELNIFSLWNFELKLEFYTVKLWGVFGKLQNWFDFDIS
jgi:hypothetical protein